VKIGVNQYGNIEFEEVFNSITFKTANGQLLAICMRDGGFEIGINSTDKKYEPLRWYSANNGEIVPCVTKEFI
jgi:hypothetical protein